TTPEVAVLDGSAQVRRSGEPFKDAHFSMVLVKSNGRWLIDSIRETEAPARQTNLDHLQELDWMVGEWAHSEDDYQVRTVCEWVANKNFLSRRFSVSRKDSVELQGTQIVGWDASQRQLRSWFFDSDGSFGEGPWKRDGNRWIIHAS